MAKALAEKAEEEFGVFTTRLFRSITLATETQVDHQQRKLFIEFNDDEVPQNMNKTALKNCLNEYDIGEPSLEIKLKRKNCWMVKYNDARNARRAHAKLQYFKNIKKVSFASSSIKSPASNADEHRSQTCKRIHCGFRNKSILGTFVLVFVLISSIVLSVIAFSSNTLQVRIL